MTLEKPRKIVPPIYLLGTIILMYLLNDWFEVLSFQYRGLDIAGSLLIICGLFIDVWAAGLFKKSGTPVIPFHKSTALVIEGPFKFSRNPMYLGMVLIQLGIAGILGNPLTLIPIGLFVLIIRVRFINGEEQFLETIFGEDYLSYKKTVRRWL